MEMEREQGRILSEIRKDGGKREKGRGGMTAVGNMRENFGSDGIALYLDCDDGYVNVHM